MPTVPAEQPNTIGVSESATLQEAASDPLAAFRFPGDIEIIGDITTPFYTDEEQESFYIRLSEQVSCS